MISDRQILVVDDDENDRQLTMAALTQRGDELRVHTAQDGAEALDYLHARNAFKDRPAGSLLMILLDLNMPRVDGWEVLRQLKSDPVLRTIPVVVFTSSSRDHDREQCYVLGANAYVVKPIDHREYAETVRDILAFWVERNTPCAPPPGGVEDPGILAGRTAALP